MAPINAALRENGSARKGREVEGKRTRRARLKLRRLAIAKPLSAHRKFGTSSGIFRRQRFDNPQAEQSLGLAPGSFERP